MLYCCFWPNCLRVGTSTQTHFHWPAKKIGLLPALFFDEGKEWGRSRRLICPHLVGKNVADMIPALAKVRGDTQRSNRQTAADVAPYARALAGARPLVRPAYL